MHHFSSLYGLDVDMKILITGATGFIGHKLIDSLRLDHELLLISRQPKLAAKQLSVDNSQVIHINELKNMDDVDVIINLAGESLANKRWTETQKRRISESRWIITEQLIQVLKQSRSKPRVWINASAIGYYGPQSHFPINETYEPPFPDFASRVCHRWEALANQAKDFDCRVCILRFGLVLDSDGGMLEKLWLPFWLGFGTKLGNGEQMMSWISRTDLIRVILFVLAHDSLAGVFNVTTPNPVTQAEFATQFAAFLHRPRLLTAPGWLLKLMLGEMASLLLTGQNVQPQRLLEQGFQFLYPTLPEALMHIYEDE